ncbi:nuclear transport factor 2 family protein [Streptomyces sp. CA-294286]|uniref:nuclear transport factor 2 family protein n=1 Tax=Streptomyces sp. CA-294286 TaxID=3240070 RepID=UPI003D91DEC9
MTQRVELATVMDRLAVDAVVTAYAVAVDDGDWPAYEALFTPDGRADYRSAGGIEGPAREVCGWLAEMLMLFPVRQHLIVNRRLRLEELDGNSGDGAELQADYLNPMRLERTPDDRTGEEPAGSFAPNFVTGGRYTFRLLRSADDDSFGSWRVHRVTVHEKWRRTGAGIV